VGPGPVRTGAENLARTGIRSPNRPARSQPLYRLRYSGPSLHVAECRKRLRSIQCLYSVRFRKDYDSSFI
jgi:hypothetical protein